MKIGKTTLAAAALTGATALAACSPPAPSPTAPASTQTTQGAAARPQSQVQGDLRQVMRGILFPNSNVVFFAQGTGTWTRCSRRPIC